MKIEIEYEEIERMKANILRLETKVVNLEANLKSFDPKALDAAAVDLAWVLFNSYMGAVFSKLGFDSWEPIRKYNSLEHWLGKKWYNSDRLTIELEAHITTKFRNAFLRLGVMTKSEEENN